MSPIVSDVLETLRTARDRAITRISGVGNDEGLMRGVDDGVVDVADD